MRQRAETLLLFLLAAGISSAAPLDYEPPVGGYYIGTEMRLDTVLHRVRRGFSVQDNLEAKQFTYNPSTPSSAWKNEWGQTFYLDVAAHPLPQLTGDIRLSTIGNYADRFWESVNDQHRMERASDSFRWVSGNLEYNEKLGGIRAFRQSGHGGWADQGDLFNLFPEQWDTEKYRRVSGEPVPTGVEGRLTTKEFGELDVMAGPELVWTYGTSVFTRYTFKQDQNRYAFFYREAKTPRYGIEDERQRSFEWAGHWKAADAYQIRSALLYQPFRIDRTFKKLEPVAPGTGVAGSSYNVVEDATTRQDALGFSSGMTISQGSENPSLSLDYIYAGLVAGNKHEVKTEFQSQRLGDWSGALGITYRVPVEGPVPLVFEGTPQNPGPPIGGGPRGPDDAFQVTWENREAKRVSLTLQFDPTPGTWFYQYRPEILEEWNLNPKENAPVSGALQFSLVDYPTSTDRGIVFDENHRLRNEPFGQTSLAAKHPLPSGVAVVRTNWSDLGLLWRLSMGRSPATSSFAYGGAANTKPETNYFTFGTALNWGPSFGGFSFARDAWGPEDWHQQFGEAPDAVYQLYAGYNFQNLFGLADPGTYVRLDYRSVQENDGRFIVTELGAFDEFLVTFVHRFGIKGHNLNLKPGVRRPKRRTP